MGRVRGCVPHDLFLYTLTPPPQTLLASAASVNVAVLASAAHRALARTW